MQQSRFLCVPTGGAIASKEEPEIFKRWMPVLVLSPRCRPALGARTRPLEGSTKGCRRRERRRGGTPDLNLFLAATGRYLASSFIDKPTSVVTPLLPSMCGSITSCTALVKA